MSRSCYNYGGGWESIMWRGAVKAATEGKRGQALLKDLLTALDSMPKKELIAEELVSSDGEVCALGALAKARMIDTSNIDPQDYDTVSSTFNVAPALAREIVYVNDEAHFEHYELVNGTYELSKETPNERWQRVRRWVVSKIKE